MAAESDLRRHHRYSMPLEVEVSAENNVGLPARDISASGVYFTVPREFKPGSDVEFLLVFPPELVDDIPPRIRCQGRVVRVDRGERIGVAATIESYTWVRAKNPSFARESSLTAV